MGIVDFEALLIGVEKRLEQKSTVVFNTAKYKA